MTLTLCINPGGIGCKYKRKNSPSRERAIRILARIGKMRTGYRWYIMGSRGDMSVPMLMNWRHLRRHYEAIPTEAAP